MPGVHRWANRAGSVAARSPASQSTSCAGRGADYQSNASTPNVSIQDLTPKSCFSRMANAVNRDLKVGVTSNQFDALVSLRFNAGANSVTPPVTDLNRNCRATEGDFTKHYITAGGVKMMGLELRRAAEWNIFSQGIYNATH